MSRLYYYKAALSTLALIDETHLNEILANVNVEI